MDLYYLKVNHIKRFVERKERVLSAPTRAVLNCSDLVD